MRKIYASTSCIPNKNIALEPLLNSFVENSIDYIELSNAPHHPISKLGSVLKGIDAHFQFHNYFVQPEIQFVLNLAAQDREIREKSISMCEQAIELSAKFGATHYSVHAGFCANFTPESLCKPLVYDHLIPYDEAYKTFVQSIRCLADYAQQKNVLLLIENQPLARFNLVDGMNKLFLLVEIDEYLQLFRELDHPALGVLLDTGHLKITSKTLGFNKISYIEQLTPYIKAIHIHDNAGERDLHHPLYDDEIIQLLRTPEFSGLPITIEADFPNLRTLKHYLTFR